MPDSKVKVAVRDGRVVGLKVCQGCRRELICVDAPDSDFSPHQRDETGKVRTWKPRCKPCSVIDDQEYRARRAEHIKEQRRIRHAERMANDPAYRKQRRATGLPASRRWAAKPENVERARKVNRERHRQLRLHDRGGVNELARFYYALRAERAGKSVRRLTPTVIDGTAPRISAGLFREWLLAYGEVLGAATNAEAISHDLGLPARRIWGIISGEFPRVAVDIVDRALINAYHQVEVRGRVIYTLEDLYPLEEAA